MRAGRQFLRLGCVFDEDALRFLPRTIDDLFARRALLSRLSTEQPAGCVAEEVIAVSLINEARAWLELEADSGEFSARTAAGAIDVLPDLFALFEDDDVLRMFDMREPADAVIDGVSDAALWLGVADQRLEAWFIPFGGVAPTGYVDDRPQS